MTQLTTKARTAAAVLLVLVLCVQLARASTGKSSDGSRQAADSDATKDSTPHSIELTPDNWEETTQGKSVLAKFFAPWCGHCQDLAPHWTRLHDAFMNGSSNPNGIIAQVNCVDHESWCSQDMQITAFPTVLYGDASQHGIFLRRYDGEKTFDALLEFAQEKLRHAACSPLNLQACADDDERQQMELYWSLSTAELERLILEEEKRIDDQDAQFKRQYQQMQEEYNKAARDHGLNTLKPHRDKQLLKEVMKVLREK